VDGADRAASESDLWSDAPQVGLVPYPVSVMPRPPWRRLWLCRDDLGPCAGEGGVPRGWSPGAPWLGWPSSGWITSRPQVPWQLNMPARLMKEELVELVQRSLGALANPVKAKSMAAYARTTMPFYGIQKPDRVPLHREMKQRFRPRSRAEYEECVLALWTLPHREEKYTALEFALQHRRCIVLDSLPLYERLIREGAWWDFVDFVAPRLVGALLLEHRHVVRPVMDVWIDDDDLWIRRSAIISQLKHRDATDEAQLFGFCLRRSHEREFFIRKAIGWALREYSKSAPDAVARFLTGHSDRLSGLSYREGAKRLVRAGVMRSS